MASREENLGALADKMAKPVRHHINGDAIPEFDPAKDDITAEEWVRRVDQLSVINEWTEAATIHYAVRKLKGLADTWYKSLTRVDFSWVEWKEKIVAAFPTKIYYPKALEEMLARKKQENESYSEYYYSKLALLNRVRIMGKEAVECLTHGIPSAIVRTGAEAGQHKTPESLFEYLNSVKGDVGLKKPQSNSERRGNHPVRSGTQVGNLSKCFGCGNRGHKLNACPKNFYKDSGKRDRDQKGSWRGGEGRKVEWQRDESKKGPSSSQSSNQGARRCFVCNESGHFTWACPKKKADNKESQASI
jgi:hypothetical protein